MSEDALSERHTVFDRLADQVMHLSNAAISGSLTFDRDLLITIEMDYEGAAALADRLEQSEDNAKAERKAGAVGALREVETARDEAETRLADTNEPMSRTVLHAAAWGGTEQRRDARTGAPGGRR